MNEQDADNDYVLAFDHFYTTNHIQILKSLLPYLDHQVTVMLPVLIKYMELQYTLDIIKKGERPCLTNISACHINGEKRTLFSLLQDPEQIEQLYHAIHKYLAPEEEHFIQQILQMIKTMENVKEMKQMMEIFQSMQTDASGSESNSSNASSNPLGNIDLDDLLGGNTNLQEMMQLLKMMQ